MSSFVLFSILRNLLYLISSLLDAMVIVLFHKFPQLRSSICKITGTNIILLLFASETRNARFFPFVKFVLRRDTFFFEVVKTE